MNLPVCSDKLKKSTRACIGVCHGLQVTFPSNRQNRPDTELQNGLHPRERQVPGERVEARKLQVCGSISRIGRDAAHPGGLKDQERRIRGCGWTALRKISLF